MESALLGLVLDSSAVISAERKKQPIPKFIEAMLRTHGPLDLSLSPVTVAELVVRAHAGEPNLLFQLVIGFFPSRCTDFVQGIDSRK